MSNEAKPHTPGPWSVAPVRDDSGRYLVEPAAGNTDTSLDAVFIARCSSETDAKLIAAAPDLLDALRLAEGFIADRVPNTGEMAHVWLTIRAVIAKATGA